MTQELSMPIDIIKKANQTPKILEISDSELAQQLSVIYFMIGLRPQHFPTPEEDKFLFAYIRTNFGHKGVKEIFLAFDLALKGLLDIEDIKVYDQFSIEYLMRIMNAYRLYCKRQFSEVIKPNVITIEDVKLTHEDKLEEIQRWKEKKEIIFKILPTYLHDWLLELNIIEISNKDKLLKYSKATLMRENELRNDAELENIKLPYRNFMQWKKDNFVDLPNDEILRIENIYKRIVTFEYLKGNYDKKD